MLNDLNSKLRCSLVALSLPLLVLTIVPLVALLIGTSPAELWQGLQEEETRKAIRLSLETSIVSTLITVLIGTPLAVLLAEPQFRCRNIIDRILQLIIVLPPAVSGIALLLAFGRHGIIGQWLAACGITIVFTPIAVVIAQIFVSVPYFVKAATVGLAGVDNEFKLAASLEGAGPLTIFRRITLPLAWRGFAAGIALAWTRSLGEFGATIVFAGNFPGRTQTMPLAVYVSFESHFEQAVTLSVILLAVAVAIMLVVHISTTIQSD
jgi:molybdate transport system permease protein